MGPDLQHNQQFKLNFKFGLHVSLNFLSMSTS